MSPLRKTAKYEKYVVIFHQIKSLPNVTQFKRRFTMPNLPRTRTLTIIAQDPSVKDKFKKVLKAQVEIPAETLAKGPRGYRVNVIDYDTSTGTLYIPKEYDPPGNGKYEDPFKVSADLGHDDKLLGDPHFHEQNVYAIVMKTLARFEFALGRRVSWGFQGHQINVAPHAFADANAFYSERDRALLFGYFVAPSVNQSTNEVIFTCLSHDVVAHETAHALLDGLRGRYTMPSSPEQSGFHEGFADIIALLSMFSLKAVIGTSFEIMEENSKVKKHKSNPNLIDIKLLKLDSLKNSILFGLADEVGQAVSGKRKGSLRNSVGLPPVDISDEPYLLRQEFQEAHRCGEVLVAAVMTAFVQVWRKRIEKYFPKGKEIDLDRTLIIEEGSSAADQLLTMMIRGIDYTPPTDIKFGDFLSAVLTSDTETVPDDSRYNYRQILKDSFKAYGVKPSALEKDDGTWSTATKDLHYDRTHFDSLMSDSNEVFRFIWDNREQLKIDERAYTQVESVRPCLRIGPDGFAVRETIAEYVEMVTLQAGELDNFDISPPDEMPLDCEVTLYGGGTLIFDEYGKLKYQVRRRVFNAEKQTEKLKHLWENGYFEGRRFQKMSFAQMHIQRTGNVSPKFSEGF